MIHPFPRLERAVLERLRWTPAPGPPRQLHLSVTDRCFLRCIHCDIHQHDTPDLPTEWWLATIDRLADWLGPVDANFVGGEPLMRRDLEELMARAVSRGFTVSFNTNGWLLTPRRARRLSEAGVSIAYVSLDGLDERLVDWTRGRRGAFRRALAAIDHLEAVPNPRVIVATVLHGRNAGEIPRLLRFVRERGLELVVQPLFENFGTARPDPRWYRRSPLWPEDPAPVEEALDLLLEERLSGGPVCNPAAQLRAMKDYFRDPTSDNGRSCRAGFTDLAVDPEGQLRLCFNLPPVGRADEPSLARVWTRPGTLRRRWEIAHCHRPCNLLNCNFADDGPA